MTFDVNSTIGDILKEKPDATKIFEKHTGQSVDPSQLAMAMGMTVQQVAGYIGWSAEKVAAILKEVNEL